MKCWFHRICHHEWSKGDLHTCGPDLQLIGKDTITIKKCEYEFRGDKLAVKGWVCTHPGIQPENYELRVYFVVFEKPKENKNEKTSRT